jgi:hypothetical protein
MGNDDVPCVLPQVPLSRSRNLISPQKRHEAHPAATRLVCVVTVRRLLRQHEFDGPSAHTKSMTLPYVMWVGISFKTCGKYLYAIPHDTRSLKVAYSYSSTFASMRDRQKRRPLTASCFLVHLSVMPSFRLGYSAVGNGRRPCSCSRRGQSYINVRKVK